MHITRGRYSSVGKEHGPGEGMEEWVWEEIGNSVAALLELDQDISYCDVELRLCWLEAEHIILQHQLRCKQAFFLLFLH